LPGEHLGHVADSRLRMILIPAGVHLVHDVAEDRLDDLVLGFEVVVQIALADAAGLRDPVRRDGGRPELVEESQGGIDDSSLGLARGHGVGTVECSIIGQPP
jgi:hypothetical protein